MKKPDPSYITGSGKFRILSELPYADVVNFVIRHIKSRTFFSVFYFLFNILTFLLIVYSLIEGLLNKNFSLSLFSFQLVSGMLTGSILVIPLHEGLHALAYKIAGAPALHFGADMKQMVFYVSAHNYVINRRFFYFIALAPFIVINIAGAGLYIFGGYPAWVGLLSFLFFHNIMCIGDFAMLSFFEKHKNKELYTFDDLNRKVSYIYEKIPE